MKGIFDPYLCTVVFWQGVGFLISITHVKTRNCTVATTSTNLAKLTISYLWPSSVANSYIQPSLASHFLHVTSRTMCLPVSIIRSWVSLKKSTKSHDGYNSIPYYFKARISEEMDETVTQLTMSVFVGRTQNNLIITLPL